MCKKEVRTNISNLEFKEFIMDNFNIKFIDINYLNNLNPFVKSDLIEITNIKEILLKNNINVELKIKFNSTDDIIVTVDYIYLNDSELYFINRLIENFKAMLKTWSITIKSNILFE